MTIHLKTSFSPDTAPLATLVQPTLFDALTFSGLAGNIAYQSTGGILTGLVFDPCMQLTWTGATFNKTAFVRKYINYSPSYDDNGWETARPTHYRFSTSMSLNGAGFTANERVQIMRFFHNSGATGSSYAGVWLVKSVNGWKMQLDEYLWSGSVSTPNWDFYTQTLNTFTPYVAFSVDVVNVRGASHVLVGQPYPGARSASFIPGSRDATAINNEGYTMLSMAGATLPRIAGFDFGSVTLATVVATLITGCAFRFDDMRFEDNFDLNWSPDQNDAILGTQSNDPFAGWSNDCDVGFMNLFPTMNGMFGAPLTNLYTVGLSFNQSTQGTHIPSTNIAVEPNAVYRLTANAPSGWTGFGSTYIAIGEWKVDMAQPTTVEYRNMASELASEFTFRTGPRQNFIWLVNNQNHLMTYNLRRLR